MRKKWTGLDAPYWAVAGAIVSVTSCLLLTPTSQDAWSQTARTIKIIVPNPPGGSDDTLARMLVDYVSRTQNATIVIESRPGAATTIGTEAVSRAAPDGNTLLINTTAFVIGPH